LESCPFLLLLTRWALFRESSHNIASTTWFLHFVDRALILIVGLGILALYTGYVIGQFRERHPHIHNLADAGEILMGRFGRGRRYKTILASAEHRGWEISAKDVEKVRGGRKFSQALVGHGVEIPFSPRDPLGSQNQSGVNGG